MDLTPREKLVLSAALTYATAKADDVNEWAILGSERAPDERDIAIGDFTGEPISAAEYGNLIAKLLHGNEPAPDGGIAIRCVVSCRAKCGVPTFYGTTVSCTQEEYDDGCHYEVAAEEAGEAGYENVGLVYDENDGPSWLFKHVFPRGEP